MKRPLGGHSRRSFFCKDGILIKKTETSLIFCYILKIWYNSKVNKSNLGEYYE